MHQYNSLYTDQFKQKLEIIHRNEAAKVLPTLAAKV